MAQLTMTVSRAQLNALGSVTVGFIDFPSALPANVRIVNVSARNKGTAFTSSGGTLTGITVRVAASGQTTSLSMNINNMHIANNGGQNGAALSQGAPPAAYPFETGFTPAAQFLLNDPGVTMGNLTDGDDGIEVTITYL